MGVIIDPAIAVGVKHKGEVMQILVFHITGSDPPASRCEALRAGVQGYVLVPNPESRFQRETLSKIPLGGEPVNGYKYKMFG